MSEIDLDKPPVILLCNFTMNFAEPWLESGHTVIMVDPQHPQTGPDNGVVKISDTVLGAAPTLQRVIRRAGGAAFVAGSTDDALKGR